MLVLLAALIVAGAVVWGCVRVAAALERARQELARGRAMDVLRVFASASSEARADPRAVLTWGPLAKAARQLYPEEFGRLDRAYSATFPLSADQIQNAHAQWTADWLAWERTHDADYKLKAAIVEEQLARSGDPSVGRARLDAVEREKLELYQRRYTEYIKVAKALQAIIGGG